MTNVFGNDWQHSANEWADTACNALQWLKNIAYNNAPMTTAALAIDDIEKQIARCRGEQPESKPEVKVAGWDGAEVTEWFDGSIKPFRIGVYQQMGADGVTIGYQRWDGKCWRGWSQSPDVAAEIDVPVATQHQNDPWRGLKGIKIYLPEPCSRECKWGER